VTIDHRREVESGSGRRRPAGHVGRAPTADPGPLGRDRTGNAGVISLQRRIGNRATGRLLASSSQPVQRFVGPEHKTLGDSTGAMIDLGNGVVLSWGDVVALAGDQYANLDDLLADTRHNDGRQRLRAAIEQDEIAGPASATLPAPTPLQVSERGATYLKLAADNAVHFNADGAAIGRWSSDHAQAVAQALEAGLAGDESRHQIALAREAFAQHFLTDSFSGGHARTPRADIIGWYRANFAPVVVDRFLSTMTNRVIDGLTAQISPQTNWPDFLVRRKVSAAIGAKLAAAIAKIGGRAALVDAFALAVAGAISGAMHDLEGKRGVMVTSEDHPVPWRAYGDDQLADSPVSQAQAERAVATARQQVEAAFAVGRQFGRDADRSSVPALSYFGFDSAVLAGPAAAEVDRLARYLRLHPEAQLTVVGHTDPTGSEAHNEALGLRRAQAVAAALAAGGIGADQVVTRSEGRANLVATSPAQYRLNRRATYAMVTRPGPYRDPLHEAAAAAMHSQIGPANAVTRYIPHPVAASTSSSAAATSTGADTQVALEEWRWGSIPAGMRGEIDAWVRGKASPVVGSLASSRELDDQVIDGYTVRPRPLAQAQLNELLANPSKFLSQAFGRPMGP
jgi:outer membrane protein OmpA-like peptidoglycan-associated protein